jgi:putative transcriptional regulator
VLVPSKIDVSAIRKKMHMSRQKFCDEFGFSLRTLEKWERGERMPESSARAYLMVIANDPKAVINALHKA